MWKPIGPSTTLANALALTGMVVVPLGGLRSGWMSELAGYKPGTWFPTRAPQTEHRLIGGPLDGRRAMLSVDAWFSYIPMEDGRYALYTSRRDGTATWMNGIRRK